VVLKKNNTDTGTGCLLWHRQMGFLPPALDKTRQSSNQGPTTVRSAYRIDHNGNNASALDLDHIPRENDGGAAELLVRRQRVIYMEGAMWMGEGGSAAGALNRAECDRGKERRGARKGGSK
jgi:hypothetical protein